MYKITASITKVRELNKADATFYWTENNKDDFKKVKEKISTDDFLSPHDKKRGLGLFTDGS